jgi:hypothetical protein
MFARSSMLFGIYSILSFKIVSSGSLELPSSRILRAFRDPFFTSDLVVTISEFVERVNDISRSHRRRQTVGTVFRLLTCHFAIRLSLFFS